MNRYVLFGLGLMLFALSFATALDSAEVSASFLDSQFNFPRLGYVIAGSVVVLGFCVNQVKEHKQMYKVILACMVASMVMDAATNVLAKEGDVKAASAALKIRSEAQSNIEKIDEEVEKLEKYKAKLAAALKLQKEPEISEAQAIVSAEGYPIPVDGKWGPKTQKAVESYSTWVRNRLATLHADRKPEKQKLKDTEKALEFSLTREAAIAYGIGMTLGGWVLSFLGGFLLSICPKPEQRKKQIEKADKKAANAITSQANRLRQIAQETRNAATAISAN